MSLTRRTLAATVAVIALVPAMSASAATLDRIRSFGNSNDGQQINGGLLLDKTGELYGTATGGGGGGNCPFSTYGASSNWAGCGNVYKLTKPTFPSPNWDETVVHNFHNANPANGDGVQPYAGLVFNGPNAIVTTTSMGGTNGCNGRGCGAVVRLIRAPSSPDGWLETTLFKFPGAGGGAFPLDSLTTDAAHNIYGTTKNGGNVAACASLAPFKGCGVVFRLTPTKGSPFWTESVLYAFKGGRDGKYPTGSVIFGKDGALYGTTEAGGNSRLGVAFKLTKPKSGKGSWTETVIHHFAGGGDGAKPYAGVTFDSARKFLYGTTQAGGSSACGGKGCGVVYRLSPPAQGSLWPEKTLHPFKGGDGAQPMAPVAFDKAGTSFYGTTFAGGNVPNVCGSFPATNGCGTVFKMSFSGGVWHFGNLWKFSGNDGSEPVAPVLVSGAVLFGTTQQGGDEGSGTAFRLSP